MIHVLKIGSLIGLGLTVVPSLLVFSGTITWDVHVVLMAIGALLWFATAPFWMVEESATPNQTDE